MFFRPYKVGQTVVAPSGGREAEPKSLAQLLAVKTVAPPAALAFLRLFGLHKHRHEAVNHNILFG
jgi:hypothetical protein